MPQAIPIIIAAAGSYVGASALTLAIAQILAAAAVGLYERDKARKKAREAFSRGLQDRIFTIRSGVAPRQYVVGTVRTGGVLMNADTLGANKSGFDTVIAYANNRCELVSYFVGEEDIGLAPTAGRFGKEQVNDVYEEFVVNGPSATINLGGRPVDDITHAAYHAPGARPGVASVTLAPTGTSATVSGMPSVSGITVSVTYKLETGAKLRLQFKLGTSTQDSTQWTDFHSERWTENHRLRGVCHARALYVWDEDIWSNGAQEIGVILKGGPAETPDGTFGFYDPRSGTTLTYNDNPAITWGWWRTLPRKYGGMGVPSAWIDWQSVAIAANICDELITVKKFDGSGYEQIKRYQCHAVLSTDRSAADNEQIILSSMAGKKAFTAGFYRLVAGSFRPAAKTIRDADIVGDKPIAVVNADPTDLPKNVCTARFSNAQKNYSEAEPKQVRNSSYITADGGEREPLDLSLEGSTDERQVNYLMGVALETQRPAFGVTLSVRGIGEDLAVFDTVTLSLTNRPTYANRTLEVVSSIDNWDGTYDLTLAEIKPTSYALDPDTFTPVDPPELPDLDYLWNIPAITGFSVDPIGPVLMPDGTTFTRIECSWDPPPVEGVQQGGRIEIRYKSSRGDWIGVAPLPGDSESTTITAAIIDSDIYQFQIRAVSSIGAASPWTDTFAQITGTPIDVKSLRLIASSLIFKVPVSGSGTIEPAVINLDIVRGGGLANAVTWTTTPTVTLGGSGDNRTLSYVNFPSSTDTVLIDVEVEEDNKLFIDRVTIARIRDGADGPDYVPDLTAPPTPSGLTATPALLHNILEWTAPTYTVGHGHSSTEVYGAPVGATQPTFGNATKLGGTPSTLFAHLAGAGQRYAYWIKFKSVDGVLSAAPAGGTNGVQATPGKIGSTDLNDLIVTAQKLADGSVTAQKVADGAIAATKFASSIQPVTIVSTVPAVLSTRAIFNITDQKLYHWNGSAYIATTPATDITGQLTDAQIAAIAAAKLTGQITSTQITDGAISTPKLAAGSVTSAQIAADTITAANIAANAITAAELSAGAVTTAKLAAGAVTANELAANSVVAGKIAAGAVSAQQIAAGAITTDKLLVGGVGSALNDDPGCVDATAWAFHATGSASSAFALNVSSSVAPGGGTVMRISGPTGVMSRAFPVFVGKRYRVSCWAKQIAGSGLLYLRLYQYDASGTMVAYNVGVEDRIAGGAYSRYVGYTDQAATALQARVVIYGNWTGPNAAVLDVTDIRCEEVVPGELIVDGAITAEKIHAGAIAVGTAAIANGAIVNAMIGTAAIDSAKIADGSIVNAKIGAAAVGSANIVDASITNAKIGALAVDTLKIQGNAVTVPSQARLGAPVNFPLGASFYDVLALVIVTTGAPVMVNAMVSNGYRMQILRDGGVIYDSIGPFASAIGGSNPPPTVGFSLDQPAAGAHTYTIRIWASSFAATVDTAAIVTLETKK